MEAFETSKNVLLGVTTELVGIRVVKRGKIGNV